jgi:hypothetical protein
MAKFTIRDGIGAFAPENAQGIVRESLEEQGAAAESNLTHFKNGRVQRSTMGIINTGPLVNDDIINTGPLVNDD